MLWVEYLAFIIALSATICMSFCSLCPSLSAISLFRLRDVAPLVLAELSR